MGQTKAVLIGGGTGLSVMARGSREFPIDIVTIVAVADNGGSTGKIRGETDIPAPGGIRNVIAALSDSESVLSQLLQYRFEENQVSGHSLGNSLIASMINVTDDFGCTVKALSKILNIKGRVIPSTNTSVKSNAVIEDGEIIFGETNIPKKHKKIGRVSLKPNDIQPMKEAIDALKEADLIVLGPGSLYMSTISNLCVSGTSDALIHSDTPRLYISNVMTQPGETDGYSVKDHISAIYRQAGQPFIDYVIYSTQTFNAQVLKKYEERHSRPVEVSETELERESIDVKTSSNLVEISENHLVRHNTKALSTIIYDMALELISTIPLVPSDKHE